MRYARFFGSFVLIATLASMIGCAKINANKSFDLDVGEAKHFTLDNVGGKIRVEVSSTEPVNVDVVVADKADSVLNEISSMKRPAKDKVLDQQSKTKAMTSEVTVPGSQGIGVVVSGNVGPKKASVKIDLKN